MSKRPAQGFFDAERKQQRLEAMDDLLVRLDRTINWESFRPRLEAAFPLRDASKGGQPPYDQMFMFKILVLTILHDLSDRPRGFYLLTLRSNEGISSHRVVLE